MRGDIAVTSRKLVRDPGCTRCRLAATAQYVCLLGTGAVPCDVMMIGEAPGKREDAKGKPFVGDAGQYLDEVLEDTGFNRRDIFITNAVSCRPPENHTPTKTEIKACNHWLFYQIKRVRPKFVLLMGNVALEAITGEKGIKKARGKPFEKDGILYLPTYHPSYIRRGDYKDDPIFRSDMQLLKTISEGGGIPKEKRLSIKIVDNVKTWRELLSDLIGAVSLDLETTGLYPWAKKVKRADGSYYPKGDPKNADPRSYDARVVSIGFGTRHHQYLIPTHLFQLNQRRMKELTAALDGCFVIAHNGKFDTLWMLVHFGVKWRIDFDTMIAHYMLDENSFHDLKTLAQRFEDAPNWDVEGEAKKEWSPTLIKYHAHDLFYTRRLRFTFGKMLDRDPKVARVFWEIMMPCVEIFRDAEFEGVYLDLSRMDEVETILRKQIRKCEKDLNKHGDILWSSPKQLSDLLFVKLKIPVVERTKTGQASTSESVLKRIDHPMVKALLDFRGAKQQLSFFIEGWRTYIVNHRLHPSFKLTGTITGRLSCENPNLQQVPRDPVIRSLIIAPPGWVLIEADLSQIELRIAAELSGDRALTQAFLDGEDPHWITALNELERGEGEYDRVLKTAAKVLGKRINDYGKAIEILLDAGADACIEIDYAWKELRKRAKAVNFGYLYGMWWRKFKDYARDKYDVHLTEEEAQESRKAFFALYRDLERWHKRQRSFVHNTGYVRSLSGRMRRLPDALSADDNFQRQEAERQAINSPVQSFANELNLMALVQLAREFGRDVFRPIGTVHDSILAYVRKDMVQKVAKRIHAVMCHPQLLDDFDIDLRIPIESEISVGPWGKSKRFVANDNERSRRAADKLYGSTARIGRRAA